MGVITSHLPLSVWGIPETAQKFQTEGHRETEIYRRSVLQHAWSGGRLQVELPSQPLDLTQPFRLSPTAHHPTPHQHGDPETPSSGDEGEILSAEGPPAQELEPSTREEMITPDFQEPLVSSGDEEPLILAGKQQSQETPSPASGGFTLVSRPSLEAEEVWLSTAAPSPSSPSTAVGTHTEATPTGPIPRRRGRFKGLNGRHFQQQEPQQGLEMGLEAGTQPPTPEAAGNHVEPPLATGATDASGSSQSQSPWAVLTNEVDVPEAGEWGPRGEVRPAWGSDGDAGRGSKSQLGPQASPSLRSPLFLGPGAKETQQKELLRDNSNYSC